MSIITITQLQELRYPNESRECLAKEAKDGHLPGAFQRKKGGMWRVDLDVHDRVTRDLIETHASDSTDDTTPEQEAAIIEGIYEEFRRAGQEND